MVSIDAAYVFVANYVERKEKQKKENDEMVHAIHKSRRFIYRGRDRWDDHSPPELLVMTPGLCFAVDICRLPSFE
jgi:hypothetical protein